MRIKRICRLIYAESGIFTRKKATLRQPFIICKKVVGLLLHLFGGRSLSLRGSLLAATTGALGLGGSLLTLAGVDLVVVDKLHQSHLSGITFTVFRHADDAGVATRTRSHFRADLTEQLGHGVLVLQVGENNSAVARTRLGRGIVFRLSLGNQGLNVHAQSLGLGCRGDDAFVKNQRRFFFPSD